MSSPTKVPPIPLRIAASGKCLPAAVVTSAQLDEKMGVVSGWTAGHTGVETRHYAITETAAALGASALTDALQRSAWGADLPDLLMSASGTVQQPIPCTAALVAAEMGWSRVPCFDVNATCLGFVAALQVAGGLIAAGTHERIAIVCSEVASKGLNYHQHESAGLIGDGAATVLVERDATGQSAMMASLMETWPEGVRFTEIRGGGSKLPATKHETSVNTEDFLFHMDGPAVFRLAAQKMGPFVERLIGADNKRWNNIDWVIPHQASLPGIRHLGRRLGIPAGKLVECIQHQGNVIAASMPLAMHEAIITGRLQRGQTMLLLGTSAGFSLGGALLMY